MYAVFGFWYLCTLPSLAVAIRYLVGNDGAPLRPISYYLLSFVFGVTVTSVLAWLYFSGQMDAWPIIILGTAVFLPEAIYSAWSKAAVVQNKSK